MSRRFFNIAGPCNPAEHYMLPAQERLSSIGKLIEQRQFFVIHAARQSGKTTLLKELTRTFNAGSDYHALYCSLESVQGIDDMREGVPAVVRCLASAVEYHPSLGGTPFAKDTDFSDFNNVLRKCLTRFCATIDRPLILFFDEADCLADSTLICFLRQLREGYINRADTPFVHSLALVGMRWIRNRFSGGTSTRPLRPPGNIPETSLSCL